MSVQIGTRDFTTHWRRQTQFPQLQLPRIDFPAQLELVECDGRSDQFPANTLLDFGLLSRCRA